MEIGRIIIKFKFKLLLLLINFKPYFNALSLYEIKLNYLRTIYFILYNTEKY